MEVATGAMIPLLRKLGELLQDEYNLERRVKKGVNSLLSELEMMHPVLRKVGEMHPDQLDEQVRVWAGMVRELSYDMEDAVDAFIVRVEEDRYDRTPNKIRNKVKKYLRRITKLFSKGKALHQIAGAIQEAQDLAKALGDLRHRYMIDAQTHNTTHTVVDPRLKAAYKDATELIGVEDRRDELVQMLTEGAEQDLKIVSIVGFGGLGKTTLARAVYDKIRGQFDCGAFVSVSENPDMKKFFKKVLFELDKSKFAAINEAVRDEEQLIDELKMFLHDKRYIIIIDDIWNVKAWEIIKCAFSNNNHYSRIITTSRIVSVSKACCLSSDDMIYSMKPLSSDDSQRLFYKRLFPHDSTRPPELEQASQDMILKKCGGVPLAIITIASILATDDQVKTKDQWHALLKSSGHGFTEDTSVEEMQRILLFSYYDLPSHLKTCLLYLSMFPEDITVWRDQLIWMWIAERFVHRAIQDTRSLYEIGDSYFNDLINRNMIEPLYIIDESKADACRVHDMILDVIRSKSSEENFVAILDGTEGSIHSSQRKIRRLSLQNSMSQLISPQVAATSMSQVRSIISFFAPIDGLIQSVSCFQFLRVLNIKGSKRWAGSYDVDLRHVMNLLHLRYLGLRDTHVGDLPSEIGRLGFLQTLDLRGTLDRRANQSLLPSAIVRLGRLMCLYIDVRMKMPVGMGSLASLEQLRGLYVDGSNAIEIEIGQLIELRVLGIRWQGRDEGTCDSLVVSLANLQKMQSLTIDSYGITRFDVSWDSWVPPPHLHTLVLRGCTSMLPRWINSSSLPLLSHLHIAVDEVRGKDIQILGTLPVLCDLRLESTQVQTQYMFITGTDYFPCVRECRFEYFTTSPSMFPRGSMPRLESLKFYVRAVDIACGELDVSMGHLPSLQRVDVVLWNEEGSSLKLEEAKAALRFAVEAHPNRPSLTIRCYF